jgi:uncharacterized protein YecT (DUF1311 family)
LLAKLESELKVCEITREGYHPREALAELQKAQQAWLKFIRHECMYAYETFGGGTDSWHANLQCEVEHYVKRSRELRIKLKEAQEAKELEMPRNDPQAALHCAQ